MRDRRGGARALAAAAAAAVLTVLPAAAQDLTPAQQAHVDAAWASLGDLRYLDAETAWRKLAFDAQGRPIPGFANVRWAEVRGLLTGIPGPVETEPNVVMDDAIGPAQIARLRAAMPHDAIAEIVRRARDTRVVFLNEDHASPRDRAFGLAVAKALRPLGYDILAVETLANQADDTRSAANMATLVRDGYPRRMSGTYLRDPVFGDFLRQALALGYRPIAYEITDHGDDRESDWKARIAKREQAQADHLVRRALTRHPGSKLLVYVGFSHATEAPQADPDGGEPIRWLATRIKAMTGIDPLTIDQTVLNGYGSGDTHAYRVVEDRVGAGPVTFFDGDRPLVVGGFAGLVDLQVAHPPERPVGGRPAWLAAMGRTATPIPASYLPRSGTRLVQAFVAAEAKDAIPVDQVLVTAGQPAPVLMLPAAPVRFAVQDAGDSAARTPAAN